MSVCSPHRSFSDEHGPGTFHSLGDLPKRKQSGSRFHIPHDSDENEEEEEEAPSDHHAPVPFPVSTALPSDSPPTSPRPRFSTGDPILLSNGKPLKSSLKSSTSSPLIATPSLDHRIHLRARSEPSTPAGPPKNVHFPETDFALATVRVYHRSARPAALSSPPNGNGDETETEGEDAPPTRFPFPPSVFNYEIDPTKSSPVPCQLSPVANLIIESLNLSPSSSSTATKTFLTGSILVRNLAFEKHIAIRFTLDDWQTVSEVGTRYLASLPHLPSQIRSSPSPSVPEDTCSHKARGWDRFTFTIRLEDHAHSLTTRTLWLAARYRVNSTYPLPGSTRYGPGGEWWDNNGGRNYCIGFRPAVTPTPPRNNPRRHSVSASTLLPPTPPQPTMACKDLVFGHMVPPAPSHQENRTEKRPLSLRAGKLSLCNYVPPTTSPSSITNSELSSAATIRPSADEDAPSPSSSTPSLSPVMVQRMIISGQPATVVQPQQPSQGEVTGPRPSHVADWDWPAPSERQIEGPLRQRFHLGPISELPKRQCDALPPSGGNALADGRSLYDTFVRQWCFAQGPSPNHHGYDGGGIMA